MASYSAFLPNHVPPHHSPWPRSLRLYTYPGEHGVAQRHVGGRAAHPTIPAARLEESLRRLHGRLDARAGGPPRRRTRTQTQTQTQTPQTQAQTLTRTLTRTLSLLLSLLLTRTPTPTKVAILDVESEFSKGSTSAANGSQRLVRMQREVPALLAPHIEGILRAAYKQVGLQRVGLRFAPLGLCTRAGAVGEPIVDEAFLSDAQLWETALAPSS